MAPDYQHNHGHVHLGEADWARMVVQTELEGELLLGFVTESAQRVGELRGPNATPVRRVIDIGSGPGVGTCELARLFPDARVVAVDGSPAMLERVMARAAEHDVSEQVSTHVAELPDGLDDLEPADVIWASLSLHHVGDETDALRRLRDLLTPTGLIVVAEFRDPTRVLPDDLDVGTPGLVERLGRAESEWFAAMRAGLPGSVPSRELAAMFADASLEVVDSRIARVQLDPPLTDAAREFVLRRVDRARHQLEGVLADDDLRALDILGDTDDPRGVMQRADVFIAASRQVVVARPRNNR